jgi:hypothetical protein
MEAATTVVDAEAPDGRSRCWFLATSFS